MAHTVIFDSRVQGASVEEVASRLLVWSGVSALLRPKKNEVIRSCGDVSDAIKHWPSWSSRPWIVCGRLNQEDRRLDYPGPFINDCVGSVYDAQCSRLMCDFDWAVFSYFKTFQDDYYNFITRSTELYQRVCESLNRDAIVESYADGSTDLASLRNASFSDDGEEGILAYELAQQRGEALPIILCGIDISTSNPINYHAWNPDRENDDEVIWYEKHIAKLERLDEFIVRRHFGVKTRYGLYRVNDVNAYESLWSMASSDAAIVEATLSPECDLVELRSQIRRHELFDVVRHTQGITPWVYGQVYGGGSDEHYGIFRAQDAAITDQLWRALAKSQAEHTYPVSRF